MNAPKDSSILRALERALPPFFIGISGGSCSGKTTFSRYLRDIIGKGDCLIVQQDSYYRDIDLEARGGILPNFDAPEAIDFEKLVDDLKLLKSGQSADIPKYDFTTHQRLSETRPVKPHRVVVVEGMLVLGQPKLRALFDTSLYIQCSPEIRLGRRLIRDIRDRGRTEESVKKQFSEQVEPSHIQYVQPSQSEAKLCISQEEYLLTKDEIAKSLKAMIPPKSA